MYDERTSRRVGGVVLALVVLAAGAVLAGDCARLRPSIAVAVYFAHIGSLEEGADVQVAGRAIGKVDSVELMPASRARDRAHPLHPAGGVAVRLRVEERYAGWGAPNGQFFIAVKGVLGDAYVEIGPPLAGAAPSRPLRDRDELRGIDPPRMDQVLVKSFYNTTELRRLWGEIAPSAREIRAAMTELRATLRAAEPRPGGYDELRRSLGRATAEWRQLAGRGRNRGVSAGLADEGLGAGDLVRVIGAAAGLSGRIRAELGATGAALGGLLADIDRVRARIPAGLREKIEISAANTATALARLERATAVLEELAARVRVGQGTIGALFNDPEFSDDAKQLGKMIKREPWRLLGHPRREALEKQQ